MESEIPRHCIECMAVWPRGQQTNVQPSDPGSSPSQLLCRVQEIAAKGGPPAVDANVALAAVYHNKGKEDEADATWRAVCGLAKKPGQAGESDVNASSTEVEEGEGCRYRHKAWLEKTRRWPPKLQELFGAYITLAED